MKRIAVLGCGLVGSTIVKKLASEREFLVTAIDADSRRLQSLGGLEGVSSRQADLSTDGSITKLAGDFDVLVGALPGWMGFRALREVIEAGKDYCDISFMPEDATELNSLAKQKGVCAVVDCGVAPGIANLMVGAGHAKLQRTDSVLIMVGGLPRQRVLPWEYKAPFSPADVIEEYTRPARQRRNGQLISMPALSEVELVDVPGVGTLEAFNTDGLRSLLFNIDAQDMREKTLRYPGHADKIRFLAKSGFFSEGPVVIGGLEVRPLDLSSNLLFHMWSLEKGEREFTYMKVVVKGQTDKGTSCHTYELFDETDTKTSTSSMARTTGFPCAFVTGMMARGELPTPGVSPPEYLGRDPNFFHDMIEYLRCEGIDIRYQVKTSNDD